MNLKEKLLSTRIFIDNEFLNKYVELINNNIDTEKTSETQRHHIVPRYYYHHCGDKVCNSKDNIVNLLFKDHIKAHYYLARCSLNELDRICNEYALIRMCGDTFPKDLDSCQRLYNEYYAYNRKIHLGTHHEEKDITRHRIAEKAKGRYLGHIHIYKGSVEKVISPEDLQHYLDNGCIRGRSEKNCKALSAGYNCSSKGMLGHHQSEFQKHEVAKAMHSRCITDETKRRMSASRKNKMLVSNPKTKKSMFVDKSEIQSYIDKGYLKGKLIK